MAYFVSNRCVCARKQLISFCLYLLSTPAAILCRWGRWGGVEGALHIGPDAVPRHIRFVRACVGLAESLSCRHPRPLTNIELRSDIDWTQVPSTHMYFQPYDDTQISPLAPHNSSQHLHQLTDLNVSTYLTSKSPPGHHVYRIRSTDTTIIYTHTNVCTGHLRHNCVQRLKWVPTRWSNRAKLWPTSGSSTAILQEENVCPEYRLCDFILHFRKLESVMIFKTNVNLGWYICIFYLQCDTCSMYHVFRKYPTILNVIWSSPDMEYNLYTSIRVNKIMSF